MIRQKLVMKQVLCCENVDSEYSIVCIPSDRDHIDHIDADFLVCMLVNSLHEIKKERNSTYGLFFPLVHAMAP